MTRRIVGTALLAVLAFSTGVHAQFTLISDDLNADTSTNYMIANGGDCPGDGSVTFNFDYSTLFDNDGVSPISPAPGTTDGSTDRRVDQSKSDP